LAESLRLVKLRHRIGLGDMLPETHEADLRRQVRAWLLDAFGIDGAQIKDDSSLFANGMLNSFDLLTFVMHLETQTGRRIRAIDVNLENFDSVNKIVTFLDRRRRG
jgi:acyl carrier protein